MSKLTGELTTKLKLAILSTHPEEDFLELVGDLEERTGIDYLVETDGPFGGRVLQYLQLLNKKRTILDFITGYKADLEAPQLADPDIIKFFEQLSNVHEYNGPFWRYNPATFNTSIVKNKLPFIDRDEIRKRLLGLTSNDFKMLVVNGEPQSGLSYFGWFASHIAEEIEAYRYVEIDLKDIDLQTPGQITDADIAIAIAGKIGMPGYSADRLENFKYRSFTGKLSSYLHEQKENVTYLFFIHHFNPTVTEMAMNMVQNIAKMLYMEHLPCYLFLSGCRQVEDWVGELKELIDPVDIGYGSFNRDDLEEFYKGAYREISKKYAVTISEHEFLTATASLVSDADLAVMPSNVTVVSRQVLNWYKTFIKGG